MCYPYDEMPCTPEAMEEWDKFRRYILNRCLRRIREAESQDSVDNVVHLPDREEQG